MPLERRANGLLRVPFIRRCALDFGDGQAASAFLVNINVLGAYVTKDNLPPLGQRVTCRFAVPGNDIEVTVEAVVAWVSARQQHPVHSLPPGFGIKFRDLSPENRRRIEQLIENYVDQNPQR